MPGTPSSSGGPDSIPLPSNAQAPSNTPESRTGPEPAAAQAVDTTPSARWDTEQAPDLSDDFNDAARMPAPPEFPPDEGQGPISKWEMDRLIRERETLTLEVELTIGGTVEQATHTQIAAEREARIRYIRDRFGKMKGLAKDRFDKER